MPIPDFQSLMLPTLVAIGDERPKKSNELAMALATKFSLSPEELAELLPSGKQGKFNNRVAWAISYLYQAGLIKRPSRGFVQITDLGKQVLSKQPPQININYLTQFEGFQDFRKRAKVEGPQVEQLDTQELALTTPTETIEKSFKEIRLALEKELLEKIKESSPSFFEYLVVELLMAMGYGGTFNDIEEAVIGKVGDGGIDGIIKEDKLGLDSIYVQAKRWSSSVGRPEVQSFSGALDGKGARKGVMITTSSFTPDAKKYVTEIMSKKIVLIDGPELVKLMIDHDLGVTISQTFMIKKIDHDYFGEE